MQPSHFARLILESGGHIELTFTGDLFRLTARDRDLHAKLIDLIGWWATPSEREREQLQPGETSEKSAKTKEEGVS